MFDYRYELHAHASECSACASSPITDLVRAFAEHGYSGLVLTDHFIFGNTAVPRDLPWEERMRRYYQAYLDGKAVGDTLDFDVLFGLEHAYGDGKEALLYGIDLEFLLAHPDLPEVPFAQLSQWVRDAGGFVTIAHPFRKRDYIRADVIPNPVWFDGAEIFNCGNPPEENEPAVDWAKRHHLLPQSGADIHHTGARSLAKAGMAFSHRLRTNAELVKALKAGEGRLIVNGEIIELPFDVRPLDKR